MTNVCYISLLWMQCLRIKGFFSCHPGKWWQHFHLPRSIFTNLNTFIYLLIIDFLIFLNWSSYCGFSVAHCHFLSPGVIEQLLSSNPVNVHIKHNWLNLFYLTIFQSILHCWLILFDNITDFPALLTYCIWQYFKVSCIVDLFYLTIFQSILHCWLILFDNILKYPALLTYFIWQYFKVSCIVDLFYLTIFQSIQHCWLILFDNISKYPALLTYFIWQYFKVSSIVDLFYLTIFQSILHCWLIVFDNISEYPALLTYFIWQYFRFSCIVDLLYLTIFQSILHCWLIVFDYFRVSCIVDLLCLTIFQSILYYWLIVFWQYFRVSCLCAAWEASLQHGLRRNNRAKLALKYDHKLHAANEHYHWFSTIY